MENTMATIYLIAMLGVGFMIVAAVIDSVVSLHKKPVWQMSKTAQETPVFVERRVQQLPFVGKDRRAQSAKTNPEAIKKAA